MENVSHQNSAHSLEESRKQENRLIAIIAIVVMTGFITLLGYMFFGY